jgi:hypothetical protein
MLQKAKKRDVPIADEVIIKVLEENGYPVYESVLNFQKHFAGISYKLGNSHGGFALSLISSEFNPRSMNYNYYVDASELEGEYYFTCAEYHYNVSVYMVIDSKGRIYGKEYNDSKPFLIADSIEKFIEKDAVKNYFLEKQSQWMVATFDYNNLNEWLHNDEYSLSEIVEACDSCSTYWKSRNEDFFLTIQRYDNENEHRSAYISSKHLIDKLFQGRLKVAVGYPKYEVYRF